jgi:hypothetical protein
MSLVACSECQGMISTAASACPHCGHPPQQPLSISNDQPAPEIIPTTAAPPSLPVAATKVGCLTQTTTAFIGCLTIILALCAAYIPDRDGNFSLFNWTTVFALVSYAALCWWVEKTGTPMTKSKWVGLVGMLLFALAWTGAHMKPQPSAPSAPSLQHQPTTDEIIKRAQKEFLRQSQSLEESRKQTGS